MGVVGITGFSVALRSVGREGPGGAVFHPLKMCLGFILPREHVFSLVLVPSLLRRTDALLKEV